LDKHIASIFRGEGQAKPDSTCDFLLSLLFDPEDGDVTWKCRLTFTDLHSVISQKIELLISAAVRASSPTHPGQVILNLPAL
jgi:hypothetical protein